MTFIHSDRSMRDRRRELRNNPTLQEIILWKYLRKSALGYKFKRQHSIGPYVVDFYCARKRLIIEIDGSYHTEPEAIQYDKIRTEFLESIGYTVLRFWNNEINSSIGSVIEKIKHGLDTTPNPS